MPVRLLSRDELGSAFSELLTTSIRIRLATAWATPTPAMAHLRRFGEQKEVQIICGISANSTTPEALRELKRSGRLRVAENTSSLFHPKIYLFQQDSGTICWVGSANFTRGGFEANREIIAQFEDDGSAQSWFTNEWDRIGVDATNAEIDEYDNRYKPPKRSPTIPFRRSYTSRHPLAHIKGKVLDWSEYYAALVEADAYWTKKSTQWEQFSVFGEDRPS